MEAPLADQLERIEAKINTILKLMTPESAPVLSTEEERSIRSRTADGGLLGPAKSELVVARLLATLDAERAASAARIEVLEGALHEWKCPGCGGSGEYRWQDTVVRCAKCEGSGLHPTARAALTSEAHRG